MYATVKSYLNNEDYISAARVVSNALTVLPDNADLEKIQSNVEKATPTYLLDIVKPYQTGEDYKEYVNGETFIVGGVETTNGFTLPASGSYALFNVEGKYSSLSFLIGHLADSYTHSINAKIFLDGKLSKTIHVTSDDYANQIKVDITGVKQIKIQVEVDGNNSVRTFCLLFFICNI